MERKSCYLFVLFVVLVVFISFPGCTKKKPGAPGSVSVSEKYRPKIFLSLPEKYNTPDGMTLDEKTNTIYLSAPNFNLQKENTPEGENNPKYPGVILKIDSKNNLTKLCDLPVQAETGKVAPMGLDIGSDGNLYVADNQYFFNKDHKSRLIRVNLKDGKAVGADIVVDGFNLSNAVVCHGDDLYVSDTFLDLPGDPGRSAVYRFKLSEFKAGTVILKPLGKDPHIIAKLKTDPLEVRNDLAGADGMTMDSKGNLYVGNFGDGKFHKISFDKAGKAVVKILVNDPKILSCVDGIFCDLSNDRIYISDSSKNAIRYYTPSGKVETLWINDDTDGTGGLLDQPCEVLIRGKELIISNFDMPFPGLKNTKFDAPYTLSVINLGE